MRHGISYAVACAAAIVAFSAFAEDAYIESDGTQAINTGYFVNPKTKIEIDFQLKSHTDQDRLFAEDYKTDEFISLYISGSTVACTFGDSFAGRSLAEADYERHTVVIDGPRGQAFYVTGGETNATVTLVGNRTQTASYPLAIFADNDRVGGNDMFRFSSMKLYSFKIYEDDVLLHDYEPAIQRGAAGLYDRVTGKFLQDDQQCDTGRKDGDHAIIGTIRTFGSGGDIRTLTDAEDEGYVILDEVTFKDKQYFNALAHVTDQTAIEMDFAFESSAVNARSCGVFPKSGAGSVAGIYGSGGGFLTFQVGEESPSGVYPFFDPTNRRYRCKLDIPNGVASIQSGHTTTWTGGFDARPPMKSNYPIAIGGAMYNEYGTVTGNGQARIRLYGFRIWESGKLIRDYVPCVSGDSIGLKDLQTGAFIVSENAQISTCGGRILREAGDGYIESNNTDKQYIDTGVTLDGASRLELDFSSASSDGNFAFGMCGGASGYLSFSAVISTKLEYVCKDGDGSRTPTEIFSLPKIRRTLIIDGKASKMVIVTGGYTNRIMDITTPHTTAMKDTFFLMGARYNGGTERTYNKPMRLYGCRLYKNGEKVRDYVPCVKDGFPGLRDTMTDTFVTNPDMTKKFAFGGEIEMDTPAYVESDGTHILDTGFYPSKDTKVVCDYQLIPGFVGQARVFGAQSGVMCDILYVQGEAKYMGLVYNRYYTEAGATATDFKTIYDVVASDLWRHQVTLDLHERFYSVDGGTAVALNSVPTEGTDKEASLALFGLKAWGGAIGYPAKARIYSFEIYESGVLKHRYLPYRGADGKVCFKDAKTGQLVNTELKATETSLTVGGCGCGSDGSAFAESPADAKVFIGDTKVLTAFAPAAFSYQWYCNGEPIAGATGSTCSVQWKKSGAPDVFSVEATFDVCGQEVKKMSSPATVTYMPAGMILLIR